jgi:hypothetical protein
MVPVIVKLRSPAGRRSTSGLPAKVKQAVRSTAGTSERLHPGADDPEMSSYVQVNVPNADAASRLIQIVSELAEVEAAYVKPADETP